MRTDAELLEIFRDAFKPLVCEARVGDYGQKIDFSIYDRTGKLLRQGRYPLTHIRTDREIETHIENARDAVAARAGISLEPWSLPVAKK